MPRCSRKWRHSIYQGGTYTDFEIAFQTDTYNYILYFNKSGITYSSYNSEEVIFDFEFLTRYKEKDGILKQRVTGFMIKEGTENLTFENFACTRLPTLSSEEMAGSHFSKNLTQSECIQSRGKNIRFNRIKAYNNYAIGFYFAGKKSYNIAYRCVRIIIQEWMGPQKEMLMDLELMEQALNL